MAVQSIKGNLTLVMLGMLEDRPIDSNDLVKGFFKFEYGAAYRNLARSVGTQMAAAKMRTRYYNFLYKLKDAGLVLENREGDTVYVGISEKGKKKLASLKLRGLREKLPHPRSYKKEKGAGITIVIFDVPESKRVKRDWLRNVLRKMDFKMIQRSVWAGEARIPLSLLNDLRTLGLLKHVDIFQAKQVGVLKQLEKI